MRKKVTLSDYFTEAQLRTLLGEKRVGQKNGQQSIKYSELKDDVDAIRAKVQWQRHKRQRGEWKSKMPYLTIEEAMARFERREELRHEHLETGEQMFRIGQGVRFQKKSDIRATTIPGGRGRRGARITKRPTIEDGLKVAAAAMGNKSAAHYQWMARI